MAMPVNTALPSAIQKKVGPPTAMRTGVVTGIVGDDINIMVNISGGEYTMPYLSSYFPALGDNVSVLYTDATWLVLGSTSGSSNPNAPWTSYVPDWAATTAPSIGNGSVAGAYKLVGSTMFVRITVSIGSTTTLGTGSYSFGLPFPVSSNHTTISGYGFLFDTSAGIYTSGTTGETGGVPDHVRFRPTGSGNMSGSSPVALASGDVIALQIIAEWITP
jgi:hypothetical protein